MLLCACAGCASAAPTLLLAAAAIPMTRFDNFTRKELGEMIGLACATDFDIQVVVDADMRTWVDKLPQLCNRIDLATLSRTAIHGSRDGPCEDKIGVRPCPELLRAARSFKVRVWMVRPEAPI